MEHLWAVVQYLRDHPMIALGGVVVIGFVFYLLKRKPKFVRQAEKRFDALSKDRADYYNKQRPLR